MRDAIIKLCCVCKSNDMLLQSVRLSTVYSSLALVSIGWLHLSVCAVACLVGQRQFGVIALVGHVLPSEDWTGHYQRHHEGLSLLPSNVYAQQCC